MSQELPDSPHSKKTTETVRKDEEELASSLRKSAVPAAAAAEEEAEISAPESATTQGSSYFSKSRTMSEKVSVNEEVIAKLTREIDELKREAEIFESQRKKGEQSVREIARKLNMVTPFSTS